LKGNSVKTTLP